ncbi:50S ribosomal protein L18 [bacterium]|nr:50S ribosomal protein L18 [bacterium]|tara:strand:+ start:2604 stop:2927 length:324 start_codon:yes stop_codon:yes gene_type:complete
MSKNKRKVSKQVKRVTASRYRLTVNKSNLHIYAQIIDDTKNITLVSASSLKSKTKKGLQQAIEVGATIAKNAVSKKIDKVYLDRGNLRYLGRLKVLCESARENGLII